MLRVNPQSYRIIFNVQVNCQAFLTTFVALGATEKGKIRSEQLKKQREAVKKQEVESASKVIDLSASIKLDDSIEVTDTDKHSALSKLTIAAKKYDANHPSALGLDGFESATLSAGEFKELVRRVFNLKLNIQEAAALFQFFNQSEDIVNEIKSAEFLRYFIQLGITERAKIVTEQIQKQRKENQEREEEHQKKIEALASRSTFEVDTKFTEADKKSIMEKITTAAEGFDKTHPAAPSLEAFDAAYMPPGLFRENLKSCFNIKASPKEIGYLMELFDTTKSGTVNTKDFLIKFQSLGKQVRDEKRREFLKKKRQAEKEAAKESEEKIANLWKKKEMDIDYDYGPEDFASAIEKFTYASTKYDKAHPSAPSLDGFSGGPIKPGVFRELLRRAFNIVLTAKELASVLNRYCTDKNPNLIDGKKFLISFMKLGFDNRARMKTQIIEQQRFSVAQQKQEEEIKLHKLETRNVVQIETEYSYEDKESAMKKLTNASALYDRNSPGCVSLDAFSAQYLTPGMFREIAKKTFNILLAPQELAAVIDEYNDGNGNVLCSSFIIAFIKTGTEEREKTRLIQLEKQRHLNFMAKADHERKIKEAEEKMLLKVTTEFTAQDKENAFEKITYAAKKYDKSHPASMTLDGFEQKIMKPHVFREMIKRTFGIILTNGELAAVIAHFDVDKKHIVRSKKFLNYFLKLGIAERERDHKMSLQKLRDDAKLREREHREKMAAQWAKMELDVHFNYTPEEKKSAIDKLTEASAKFDPASPGPMGLTAFEASTLSPAIFREMLKRSFNMKLTNGELAALIDEFDTNKTKNINCNKFMVAFTKLGFDKRSEIRGKQLEKQRQMITDAVEQQKNRTGDRKMEATIDLEFSNEDFQQALEKIRVIASNYDRSHPSAPSLRGFQGTNMKPVEFKEMLMRTFQVPFTPKELGALLNFFGDQKDTNNTNVVSTCINNQEFLNYFNKIQRDEQSRKRRNRINAERELIKKQKEYQDMLLIKKQEEDLKQLIHTEADQETFLIKMKKAATSYAIDSAIYNDGIQGFKGPAMPPGIFKDLFNRIFSEKMSLPEVGVLLEILDTGGNGTIDGGKFLSWFYKLSRIEGRFLLGESDEQVTIDIMKSIAIIGKDLLNMSSSRSIVPTRSVSRGRSLSPKSFSSSSNYGSNAQLGSALNKDFGKSDDTLDSSVMLKSIKPKQKEKKSPTNKTFSVFEADEDEDDVVQNDPKSFTASTIAQNWLLPSIASAAIPYSNNGRPVSSIYDRDSRKLLEEVFNSKYIPDDTNNPPVKQEKKEMRSTTGSSINKKLRAMVNKNDQYLGEHDASSVISTSTGLELIDGSISSEQKRLNKTFDERSLRSRNSFNSQRDQISTAPTPDDQSVGTLSSLKSKSRGKPRQSDNSQVFLSPPLHSIRSTPTLKSASLTAKAMSPKRKYSQDDMDEEIESGSLVDSAEDLALKEQHREDMEFLESILGPLSIDYNPIGTRTSSSYGKKEKGNPVGKLAMLKVSIAQSNKAKEKTKKKGKPQVSKSFDSTSSALMPGRMAKNPFLFPTLLKDYPVEDSLNSNSNDQESEINDGQLAAESDNKKEVKEPTQSQLNEVQLDPLAHQ